MTRIKLWLGAIAAAFLAILGAWVSGKREGRADARSATAKDDAKRQERGRDAVQDLRGADRDDLLKRVRENDGRW